MLNPGTCCADGLGFIDPHDISACENLLEAYFMQIDFLLSRLKVLDERIDDSESTIEIELDHRSVIVLCMQIFIIHATHADVHLSCAGAMSWWPWTLLLQL